MRNQMSCQAALRAPLLIAAMLSCLASFAQTGTSGAAIPAAGKSSVLAIVSVRNTSGDPRADYLAGILQGIAAFDLGRAAGITLVDRANLDKVLAETELRLSAAGGGDPAQRLGSLLGADHLIFLEYTMLTGEALFMARLVRVSDGRLATFVERGATENAIHRLAETIAESVTGARPAFAAPSDRSVLTLRDETPGSIALHSIMQRGEIFLDGEFVGFTTGDEQKPFLLETVKPGTHTVRVHVGKGFGVVVQPALEFKDWEASVEIQPGKRLVLRDGTKSLNSILYRLQYLVVETFTPKKGKALPSWQGNFTDRTGQAKAYLLSFAFADKPAASNPAGIQYTLTCNGATSTGNLLGKKEAEAEQVIELDGLKLTLDIDLRYGEPRIGATLERTDVWQNMYDD